MCGRFVSTMPVDAIREVFGTRNAPANIPPSWNVAPTDQVMVVRRHPETGERHVEVLRWGFVPSFHHGELAQARRPIDASAETVAISPLFRRALTSGRCLIPAQSFYEWRTGPAGKMPFAVARNDGQTIAFAGLWDEWRGPDGVVLKTFAILTCPANVRMRELHGRMPVILEPGDWPLWLGEADGDTTRLLRPAANGVLRFWPVGKAVNSVRNNAPELVDQVDTPSKEPRVDAPAGPNPA